MRQEIELYLGGRSVEFNEPPEILFSYIRTDYTDPTVLRNSYSKTLTIEGTPGNNQIFNSIYHLDQIVDPNTFNPAKRMDFKLFSNGDILEQGYAKLDKVNKEGHRTTYDITLYGGLGEFLYNLSYDQTAEGSDTSRGGGEDRRLSSLVFYDETEPNKEFDFEITKETVAEAWDALESGTGATKWKYINFAPAYNGYPDDFDADKVLINTQGSKVPIDFNNNGKTGSTTGFPTSIQQGDGDDASTYRTYNNYAMGELPKEMTEWEMRDLRSYLQRPVLSMKGFMEAISNPVNNGNYNVVLDTSFFNDNNPYYAKAWFTLPLLKKDETETGQSAKTEVTNNVLSISSQLGEDYDCRYYLSGLTPGAVYNGIDLTFSFKTTVAGMPNEVLTTAVDYNAGGIFARDAAYFSCIFVQLVGEDDNGTPIAASPIYNFTSPYGLQKGWKFFFGNEYEGAQTEYFTRRDFSDYTPVMEASDINCLGGFKKISGNNYTWYNKAGNQSAFTVSLTDKLEYARVYFRVTKCYKWRNYKNNGNPNFNRFEEDLFGAYSGSEETARNVLVGYVDGGAGGYSITAKTGTTRSEVVGSQTKYSVNSDVVRSGSHISKGDLLNFDGTPCDYLLSYCKLFNLYISKDIYSNTIYIMTRDTFYNGGTIDLEKYIDRSKDISVKPLAMDSRWYDFAYPEDDKCGAAEDYDKNYGVEYGKNKVQTSFEFDSAAIDLLKDNIYQNGVQVQESSKYFTLRTVLNPRISGNKTVPTFLYNSIDYKLFKTPNDTSNDLSLLPPARYSQTGYTASNGKEDWLPKLQLNNKNEPLDGTNVLCFYAGSKTSPFVGGQQAIYYLTDDVAEMFVLNGETPCWLWTISEKNGDQDIAKGMTKLPIFSRMLYDTGETSIQYTWDFGRVRDTYVPVKAYNDKATIYERWWADYIADLYDPNTRVAEVYVKMEGKVVGDWLRAMYWWDNTYWVLTEINDYNITSYATTKCKFVRVNDIANYTSNITPPGPAVPIATLVPEKYMIAQSGETITAYVKTSDGGSWHLEYPNYVTPSAVAGSGDTTITLTFAANPNDDGREFDIRAYRTVGTPTHFWQNGKEMGEKQLLVNGNSGNTAGMIFNYEAQSTTAATITYENRGNDTVTVSSNAEWLTVSSLTWSENTAPITMTMTQNTGTTVRSATITLSAVSAGLSATIKVDQLPEQVEISNNGGSQSVTLLNTVYTVSALNAYWATIKTSGSTITFSADANTAQTARYELVGFTVDNGIITSASTQIVQACCGGILSASPASLSAESSGGDKIMTVDATGNWTATSKPDWITLSPSAGTSGQTTIIVTFAENTGTTSRSGEIVLSDGTRTATVEVSQAQKNNYLTANPTALTFDWSGGTKYVNIDSSAQWNTADVPDWISLSVTTGTSGASIMAVTASVNNNTEAGRNGSFLLSNGTNTVEISLAQANKILQNTLIVTPSSLYFDYTGGTKYINVQDMDYTWTATSKPNWVVLSQITGAQGYCMVGVTASENTGTTTRTGDIIFSDGHNTATVSIGQPVSSTTKTLTLVPNLLYVENSGGTPIIEVHYGNRNGDDVSVTSNQSWCTATLTEWNGDVGYIVLNVAPYGVNMERVATITVQGVLETGLTATATVRQKELPYITLNPTFIEFDQTGGTASIILKSNTNWIIDITDTTNG